MNTETIWPKISIVVPSLNQAHFLAETLQSLVDQEYPNLEVIIQDGCSKDNSLEIADSFGRTYPDVFKIFVQKDRNHAHALNLGFQHVTGDILGFLNSDDTLYPGCLRRVAQEIDPARSRWIVMGRCLFTGPGLYGGLEHPSEFESHFGVLAIWRTGVNTIPQPSVFWHRVVWEKCGGLDENTTHALDYELFCRFSKQFSFHKIDELWSTYRLHPQAKTASKTEREVLDIAIRASRLHWGPWWSILRWRCEISYFLHNPVKFNQAREHAALAEKAFQAGNLGAAVKQTARTALGSPLLFWNRLCRPFFVNLLPSSCQGLLLESKSQEDTASLPRYGDGWIGPNFAEELEIPVTASHLVLRLNYLHPKKVKTLFRFLLNGSAVRQVEVAQPALFEVVLAVGALAGKTARLQILASSFFYPCDYNDGHDNRRLALRIDEIKLFSAP